MGWPELMVVAVVASLVFGPERIPEVARKVGRLVKTVRAMADDARRDLGVDLSTAEIRSLDPRAAVRSALEDARPTVSFIDPEDFGPTVTYPDGSIEEIR